MIAALPGLASGPAVYAGAGRFTVHGSALRLAALQGALASTGGLVHSDELLEHLRLRVDQPLSTLARWIVDGDVVSIDADGPIWLPMFQFDADLQVRNGVRAVLRELRGVFDDWELAEWFARPNASLCWHTPASILLPNGRAVREVARLDRFVALG